MSIVGILLKAINFYEILIFISIIGSWMNSDLTVFKYVDKLTSPFLNMFRVIVPVGNARLDLSPIIAVVILDVLSKLIVTLF
jgi:YggT family protein